MPFGIAQRGLGIQLPHLALELQQRYLFVNFLELLGIGIIKLVEITCWQSSARFSSSSKYGSMLLLSRLEQVAENSRERVSTFFRTAKQHHDNIEQTNPKKPFSEVEKMNSFCEWTLLASEINSTAGNLACKNRNKRITNGFLLGKMGPDYRMRCFSSNFLGNHIFGRKEFFFSLYFLWVRENCLKKSSVQGLRKF